MQGADAGQRPTTAVTTQAEKDKFDRDVYQFLISPETRRQLRSSAVQAIDFDRFADKWNDDVGEIERNEAAGCLEVNGDPSKKINRKKPADLQHWWTESKKDVNTARTIENNRALLSSMYERNRIHVAVASSAASATVGATKSGDRFSFPFVDDGHTTVPRPAPSAVDEPDDERGNMSKRRLIGVDVNDDFCQTNVSTVENTHRVGPSSSSALNRSATNAGGGSAGPSQDSSTTREDSGTTEKDPAFVVPASACSALYAVAPSFGSGSGFVPALQVWNPMLPMFPMLPVAEQPAAKHPRVRSCQVCGHNPSVARWRDSHKGGNQSSKRVCSVPEGLRRVPDFPNYSQRRFKICECDDCKLG